MIFFCFYIFVLISYFKELKEKSTNFEKLKLEWDSNNNQIVGKHLQELADERQKALQVCYLTYVFNC